MLVPIPCKAAMGLEKFHRHRSNLHRRAPHDYQTTEKRFEHFYDIEIKRQSFNLHRAFGPAMLVAHDPSPPLVSLAWLSQTKSAAVSCRPKVRKKTGQIKCARRSPSADRAVAKRLRF
jgi:hypothetical protein